MRRPRADTHLRILLGVAFAIPFGGPRAQTTVEGLESRTADPAPRADDGGGSAPVMSAHGDGAASAATGSSGPWSDFLAALPTPLGDALALGGPVTLVLLVLSVVALTIIVYKAVQLVAERSRGREKIRRALDAWRAGDADGALDQVRDAERGVARLVRVAMRGMSGPDPQDGPCGLKVAGVRCAARSRSRR